MGEVQSLKVLPNDTTNYVILIEPSAKRADPHVRWRERESGWPPLPTRLSLKCQPYLDKPEIFCLRIGLRVNPVNSKPTNIPVPNNICASPITVMDVLNASA